VDQGLAGVIAAVLVRVVVMILDRRRQFPTHPHGEIVHLFLGFVAAVLGALAVPALAAANYTAGVFLGLGASQFHTVRGLESGALKNYDKGDAVPRGPVYIEGLALAFEARNFLIFGVALVTSTVGMLVTWPVGFAVGVVSGLLGTRLFRTQALRSVCDIRLVAAGVRDDMVAPAGPADEEGEKTVAARSGDRRDTEREGAEGATARMSDPAAASDDAAHLGARAPVVGPADVAGERGDWGLRQRDSSTGDPAAQSDSPSHYLFAARRYTLAFEPRTPYGKAILRSPAQRQAILHHLHAALGSHLRDTHGHMCTPKARYTQDGVLLVDLWPVLEAGDRAVAVAEQVPVLEAIAAPLRVQSR